MILWYSLVRCGNNNRDLLEKFLVTESLEEYGMLWNDYCLFSH